MGILFILAACFVWGFTFVIPQLLINFSSIEIALGRYLCLGLISLSFMFIRGMNKWHSFPLTIWIKAFIYAFFVNIFYYCTLVIGLRYSSPSVITLIIGLSPITISFYGNWLQKECPFRQLILPSCLIAAGLILVNIPAFLLDTPCSVSDYLFGLLCGFLSLSTWSWYAVANANFLKINPQLQSSEWANLIGIATLFWVLLLAILSLIVYKGIEPLQKYIVWTSELKNFILGIIVLGLACSWLGSYFWNRGTKSLPISLAGQLTIGETIFGLIFIYLIEHRFPEFLEVAGILVILSGVLLFGASFQRSSLPQAHHSFT